MFIGIMINMLTHKNQVRFVKLNSEYVNIEKEKYQKQNGSFVSTNDLVTSEFFNLSDTDAGMMIVNLRGRLENVHEKKAGNYIAALMYFKQDYESPNLIRDSLKSLKRKNYDDLSTLPSNY